MEVPEKDIVEKLERMVYTEDFGSNLHLYFTTFCKKQKRYYIICPLHMVRFLYDTYDLAMERRLP